MFFIESCIETEIKCLCSKKIQKNRWLSFNSCWRAESHFKKFSILKIEQTVNFSIKYTFMSMMTFVFVWNVKVVLKMRIAMQNMQFKSKQRRFSNYFEKKIWKNSILFALHLNFPKMEKPDRSDLSHHKQHKYCTNRPKYRDGRRLTAVKVNTIKIKFTFF